MTPTIYFGARVAGIRILWHDAERAWCLCRCGRCFTAYRANLRQNQSRGVDARCGKCNSIRRSEAAFARGAVDT